MEITFLGTGTSQGIPVIGCKCAVCTSSDPRDTRLRTSALVQVNGLNIVIDTGPDFRAQMLHNHVSHLDAILFTHEHNDHVMGLDDVRPYNFRQKKAMPVYGLERVINDLRSRFQYIFSENAPVGIPKVDTHKILPFVPFDINGVQIKTFDVLHGRLEVLGFRIGGLVYITDASFISERAKEEIKDCDVLVINALRRRAHPTHFTVNEAIQIAQEVNAKKTYLIHISHDLEKHAELEGSLPKNIFAAYDNLKIIV